MKSSCAADAVDDVNRGAAFLMALAPLDARRAFDRAAERDPDCALAGWGRAMSGCRVDPWRMSRMRCVKAATPCAARLDAARRASRPT